MSVRNWSILVGGIIAAVVLAWALFGLLSAGNGPALMTTTPPATAQ